MARRCRSKTPSPDTDLVALFLDDTTFDAFAPFFHEDCEIVGPSAVTGGPSERRIGLEGLRTLWLGWLDPWESYRVEIEDVIDAGEHVVVLFRDSIATVHVRVGPDLESSYEQGILYAVPHGLITRSLGYKDVSSALRAMALILEGGDPLSEA
jgi:hypothetical protein